MKVSIHDGIDESLSNIRDNFVPHFKATMAPLFPKRHLSFVSSCIGLTASLLCAPVMAEGRWESSPIEIESPDEFRIQSVGADESLASVPEMAPVLTELNAINPLSQNTLAQKQSNLLPETFLPALQPDAQPYPSVDLPIQAQISAPPNHEWISKAKSPESETDISETAALGDEIELKSTLERVNEAPEILPPTERERLSQLTLADQLLNAGELQDATKLYQQTKKFDSDTASINTPKEAVFDPTQIRAGKVYWREANDGFEQQLESKIIVPLTLLTQEYPEFVPGYLKLAEGHHLFNRPEEALQVLEKGSSIHPNVPELQEALMQQQVELKQWLPAAITARQFATLNPNHPQSSEFAELAEVYQQRFRSTLKENLASNAVGSVFTGAINVAVFGNPLGAISPIQNAVVLLRGEEQVGESAAKSYRKRLPLLEDPELNSYVNEIGQKLAKVSGRNFDYEFIVVNDDALNAFSLPGGKVFISSGAILKSQTEAELAGLIAHELSHSVLSHSFQSYTQSRATGAFTDVNPLGGLFSRVSNAKFTREMETQADILGTRLLANGGYAADGLENLVRRLLAEPKEQQDVSWTSGYLQEDRLDYLSNLIDQNGYNRYTYEGVAKHQSMQARLRQLLATLGAEEGIATGSQAENN